MGKGRNKLVGQLAALAVVAVAAFAAARAGVSAPATVAGSSQQATSVSASSQTELGDAQTRESADASRSVDEDGTYTSKDEVAAYIHAFGHLPSNFISKTKARAAGWDASSGNLDEVCPGMSIGGSQFYDDDDKLPDASGRTWTECDIDYTGGHRGAKRIVFSNDGLIYYTGDHYQTFERLY